jgi:hypothetical protein
MLALLYFGILYTTEETTRVTLFEAAMGPQNRRRDRRRSA